jgi:hypothetical protein
MEIVKVSLFKQGGIHWIATWNRTSLARSGFNPERGCRGIVSSKLRVFI